MKKTISFLLAAFLLLALVACSSGAGTPAVSPSSEAPASTAPAGTSPAQESSAPVSESPAPAETTPAPAGRVGYFDDPVDHYAREEYKLAYFYTSPSPISASLNAALEQIGKVRNFTSTSFTGEGDSDRYLNMLETVALTGVDGYIVDVDPRISARAKELLDELEMPFVSVLNPIYDENGSCIAPAVALDGRVAGAACVEWIYDNYKEYTGEIDTAKLGFIAVGFSVAPDFVDRSEGAKDKFLEYFPDQPVFDADCINGEISIETAYNEVSAILTANPEIENWWITGDMNVMMEGAARALEAAGKDATSLVSGIDSDALVDQWDQGYEGCWASAMCMSSLSYMAMCASGVIAIIDGRVSEYDLWADARASGDTATKLEVEYKILTIDNYKEYTNSLYEMYGLEKPY